MWVLVLLAIVWVAALAPMVIRKLREREVFTSVTSFNRQLLRLSGGSPVDRIAAAPNAAIGFSAAAQRMSDDRFGSDTGAISWGPTRQRELDDVPSAAAIHQGELGPVVSRAMAMRRRRVLATLVSGTLVAFLLGIIVSAFMYLGVVGLLATVTYVVLLAYFHRVAVEQVQKVVALETRRGAAMALDEARHSVGGIPAATPRPRVGGSGWCVQEPQTADSSDRLVSAGR